MNANNAHATTEKLIRDLYDVDGKSEIVNNAIVQLPFYTHAQSHAEGEIFANLRAYCKNNLGKENRAFACCVGYLCDLPHRKSFCPDVSFYVGASSGMKFVPVPPMFAVEIRSDDVVDAQSENEITAKRADYFAAGTLVVWDVDLLSHTPIKSYSSDAPDAPRIFRRGEIADAEPAVPGWRFNVDDLFV